MNDQEGICEICGCTDDHVCVRPLGLEACGWANDEHTLCTFCKEKMEDHHGENGQSSSSKCEVSTGS